MLKGKPTGAGRKGGRLTWSVIAVGNLPTATSGA